MFGAAMLFVKCLRGKGGSITQIASPGSSMHPLLVHVPRLVIVEHLICFVTFLVRALIWLQIVAEMIPTDISASKIQILNCSPPGILLGCSMRAQEEAIGAFKVDLIFSGMPWRNGPVYNKSIRPLN